VGQFLKSDQYGDLLKLTKHIRVGFEHEQAPELQNTFAMPRDNLPYPKFLTEIISQEIDMLDHHKGLQTRFSYQLRLLFDGLF